MRKTNTNKTKNINSKQVNVCFCVTVVSTNRGTASERGINKEVVMESICSCLLFYTLNRSKVVNIFEDDRGVTFIL